jgi:hypothetical protein
MARNFFSENHSTYGGVSRPEIFIAIFAAKVKDWIAGRRRKDG